MAIVFDYESIVMLRSQNQRKDSQTEQLNHD